MKKCNLILLICVLAVALGAATVQAIPLPPPFSNGSFENPTSPDVGSFTTLPANNFAIDSWTVVAKTIDWIGTYWTAQNDSRSLDMSGLVGDAGSISQTFLTSAGQQYEVTFWMAGNPDGPPTIKTLNVAVGAKNQDYYFTNTASTTRGNMGWVKESFFFTTPNNPLGLSTTLTFTSGDSSGYGPALDNVSVNAIPLPPSALLLGSGLLGLVGLRRKLKG